MNAIPTQKPKVHELKTDSAVFSAVLSGHKTYEIRKDDRGFAVDDTLILRETQHTGAEMAAGAPLIYTGRFFKARVSHVLAGPLYGLMQGWVILSLAKEAASVAAGPSRLIEPLERMTVPPLLADEAPLSERGVGFIEGWNAYDTALREQITAPTPTPAQNASSTGADKPSEALRAALSDALYEALGEALDCGRVWSAWSMGTMRESDFSSVRDDPDRLAEMVDAVLSLKPWTVVERWLPGKPVGYFFRENHDTLIQCYTPAGPRSLPDFDGNLHAQLLFTGHKLPVVTGEWPKIDHSYRPAEADAEAADLKKQILEHGPSILANELRLYAQSQPPRGSFAGRLWAMHEYLRAVFAAPEVTHG